MQLPKTEPQDRAKMYEDVKKLLTPGFLAHGLTINGIRVILRSLNENDWMLLQYRTDSSTVVNWKRWTVATSIWMVDSQLIIGDEGALQRVYQMCASLPLTLLEDMYSILNALMRKVREATEVVEAFLYEEESRYLWKSEGARLVEEGRFGIGNSGLNPIQKLWLFFNRAEDEGLQERHDWEMAKFIAGPHVPKGIKKINAKDKQDRTALKLRREGIQDRTYYEYKGVIPKRGQEGHEDKSRFGRFDGWKVQLAETTEELQDEMRRWVAEIKDPHDNVIDYVKSKIKTERETATQRAKVQSAVLVRAMEEEGVPKSQLVPMTGKAAQAFIERVKSHVAGTSKVTQDVTHNSAYEKYIKNNPDVGVLEVDDQGNITSKVPVDPNQLIDMLRSPGASEDQRTLQDLVSARRPSVDTFFDESDGGN